MRAEPKTLLAWLCDRDRLPYSRFEERFTKTGVRLFGNGTTNPTCGETQFRRWTGGKLQTLPAAPTCMVLEAMWPEYTAAQLFEPPALADPQVPANDLEERVRMTAEEALEGADATASAAVSDNTIDELRDQVEAAARQYHRMAPAQAYEALDKLRTAIERQRDRTQVPFQQQELMILNGQAAALLAVAAFDLGYFPSARSLARTAAVFGEATRFTPLQAYADGTLAYIAYHTGNPTEALAKAHRAWHTEVSGTWRTGGTMPSGPGRTPISVRQKRPGRQSICPRRTDWAAGMSSTTGWAVSSASPWNGWRCLPARRPC